MVHPVRLGQMVNLEMMEYPASPESMESPQFRFHLNKNRNGVLVVNQVHQVYLEDMEKMVKMENLAYLDKKAKMVRLVHQVQKDLRVNLEKMVNPAKMANLANQVL